MQAQSCSTFTSEAACTAVQVPYSGPATVINATIEFTVTLGAADVANFTQALTQALALRCRLFTDPLAQKSLHPTLCTTVDMHYQADEQGHKATHDILKP